MRVRPDAVLGVMALGLLLLLAIRFVLMATGIIPGGILLADLVAVPVMYVAGLALFLAFSAACVHVTDRIIAARTKK